MENVLFGGCVGLVEENNYRHSLSYVTIPNTRGWKNGMKLALQMTRIKG